MSAVLDFPKFHLRKTAANFPEISRKHVFGASNSNIKRRNSHKFCQKLEISISNVILHN